MKKHLALLFCLLLASLLCAAPLLAKTFGNGLTLAEPLPVSDLLADPERYVGQTVQIKGLVVEVCAVRGCYINIAGDKPFESVHFKVTDGDMIFPMNARGRTAVVEGVWEKIVRQNEFGFARTRPTIDKPLDPASVSTTETLYQLRGLGAVIEGL